MNLKLAFFGGVIYIYENLFLIFTSKYFAVFDDMVLIFDYLNFIHVFFIMKLI